MVIDTYQEANIITKLTLRREKIIQSAMADTTVTAGRGVVYIALAKLYFMAAGYVIYFLLPRLLGSEVLWGNYLLVIGLVSVIDNVVVTATIQAVSKFTAQDDATAEGVKAAALKVQLLLGVGLTTLYVAGAPFIARWERDEGLTSLYQLSAGIMLCYSFYAVFVGSLNGLKKFGKQAFLDTSFATLRAALILGFTALGWGVAGAIGGFVTAAAMILFFSILWVGLPRRGTAFPSAKIWGFMAQLFVYTFALNLIMRVDLFMLKRFATELSGAADALARAEMASAYAGYYGTAQTLAFIPYQAILAVAFVIFPLISRSTFENDTEQTQRYIRQTLRLSLVFVAGVAVVFMANPEAVINVPYQEKYRIGGPALRILAMGMVCFSLFSIINTILNSAGRTRQTIIAGIVTLCLAAAANAIFVPRTTTIEEALQTAALATSGAAALGMLLSAGLLYREFKATFPLGTIVRILIAMGVAMGAGHWLPEISKLLTVVECVFVLGVYFLALLALREFSAADFSAFTRILGSKRR